MIISSTQIALADGRQRISFRTTSRPQSALVEWEAGSYTDLIVRYDSTLRSYYLEARIPAPEFWVTLNTEPQRMRYEAEWGELDADEITMLESDGDYLLVPYCDLSVVSFKIYDAQMRPLEYWRPNGRRPFVTADPRIMQAYGAPTLVNRLVLGGGMVLRKESNNWVGLDDLQGGYVIELINHTRITSDRIINATVCRDELYNKKYRKDRRWT